MSHTRNRVNMANVSQNISRQFLQDKLRQGSYCIDEALEAASLSIVCDNRNAPLRTIPIRTMDAYKLASATTVSFPL